MHQASRNWYQRFTNALIQIGFRQSRADHSLFIFNKKETFLSALTYVDDVILAGNDQQLMEQVKQYLEKEFSFKDLGPLKYFIGIEVARTSKGIVLSQRKYTLDILKETGMQVPQRTEL